MKKSLWIVLALLLAVSLTACAEETFFAEESFEGTAVGEEAFFLEESFFAEDTEEEFLEILPDAETPEEQTIPAPEVEERALSEGELSSRDEHQYGLYNQPDLDWIGTEGIWVPANGFERFGHYDEDQWEEITIVNGYDRMPGGQQWYATGGTVTWQSGAESLKNFIRVKDRFGDGTYYLEFDPACTATGTATYKLTLQTDQNTTYETTFSVKANGVPATASVELAKSTIYVQPGERVCLNDLGIVNAFGGMHYYWAAQTQGGESNYPSTRGDDFWYEFKLLRMPALIQLTTEPATDHWQDQMNYWFYATEEGTYLACVDAHYGQFTEYLGKSLSFKIVVGNGGPATDSTLTLNKENAEVAIGKTLALKTTLTPKNKRAKYVWQSENPEIATVSPKGVVKGVAKGSTIIHVTETESEAEASCKVSVIQPVTEVALFCEGEPAQKLEAIGGREPVYLTATVNPDASHQDVTWKSSSAKVASVSDAGVVTLNAVPSKKTVTITATATDGSKKKAVSKITVLPIPVDSVSVSNAPASLFVKETASLSAAIVPSDAANHGVSWKSSDTKVLSVSGKGVITAKKAGRATITVTSKANKEATYQVEVEVKNRPAESVVLNMTELPLKAGKSATLKATVGPENATIKDVIWTSDAPEIATVSASGKVTAKKNVEGTAHITAEAKDGSGMKATCLVTVTK